MENGEARNASEQLDLLPREGVDWSRVETVRRVWLEDLGGDQDARLEFLADQGLRLVMADLGPGGGETLHFYNPRDNETLHLRAGGGKSLLSESSKYFPAAARWIELLRGEEDRGLHDGEDIVPAGWLARGGLIMEVDGGRIRKVFEAWRDCPQHLLCGARAGEAVALLEQECHTEAASMALAFLQAVEDARGMRVPPAALALRVMILEASRVRGQLAWLVNAATVLGRERTAGRFDGLRRELDACIEDWLGDPLGRGWMIPGGMREEFPLHADGIAAQIAAVADGWQELSLRALSLTVRGWMEKKLRSLDGEAERMGWVGPMGRAAGSHADVRSEESAVYEAAAWESGGAPESGGLLRRVLALRAADVTSSFAIMQRILACPPDAPLMVKRGRGGRGEGFGRCEGPHGETCCHVAMERGRVTFASFSRPYEVNRSAARVLEGCRLDEIEALSMLWENPPAGALG